MSARVRKALPARDRAGSGSGVVGRREAQPPLKPWCSGCHCRDAWRRATGADQDAAAERLRPQPASSVRAVARPWAAWSLEHGAAGRRLPEGARTRNGPDRRAQDCCWARRGTVFGLPSPRDSGHRLLLVPWTRDWPRSRRSCPARAVAMRPVLIGDGYACPLGIPSWTWDLEPCRPMPRDFGSWSLPNWALARSQW
jgi:hypothetical protein